MANTNNEKNRKSEAQKHFEEAENAGRFAGDDVDSKRAEREAKEKVRQDTNSTRSERGNEESDVRDISNDDVFPGEADNIAADDYQRLSGNEAEKARNKATEGLRQNRERSGDSAE
jgi:hypothetical protein